MGYYIEGMWKFQQGAGDESQQVVDYVVEKMKERYPRESKLRITKDLHRHIGAIMAIADGTCPVDAGLGRKEIDVAKWVSPARMDLALTYRCNAACQKCYLGDKQKNMSELPFDQWCIIIDSLWKIGIPQLVFTGGEPLLRDDLTRLVGYAEKFVTGLVTNGILLGQQVEKLKDASLDYIQVTIESCDAKVHNGMMAAEGALQSAEAGIRKALSLGMNVVTNTTLTQDNAGTFLDTIKWGHALGLHNMACNSLICSGRGIAHKSAKGLPPEQVKALLEQALTLTRTLGMELQWYSPTCYHDLNPVDMGLGMKECSAAQHNMTIQPDGSVLPCQSWPNSVGNILKDDWNSIWNHLTCAKLRKHEFAPEKCGACELFRTCGGGCPLDEINGKEGVR
jgi:radical SAM protein with 4Fe4S-binding SPASM domain